MVGQAAELERVREAPPLPHPELLLEGQVEELAVAHLRLLGAFDELLGVLGQVREAQTLGVLADAVCEELAHRRTSRAKSAS